MSSPSSASRARRALLVGVLVVVAIYTLPFGRLLLWPLVLVSTFAHEAGHGIAAVLVGGRFTSLSIFADASGVATHTGAPAAWGNAVIAAGGLLGPAVIAALLFVVARWTRPSRVVLGLLSLTVAALIVTVVRNPFGMVFSGLLALALALVAVRFSAAVAQVTTVFLAIVLALSVFSRGDYLFARTAETGAGTLPSDTMQIATSLGGPHLLWAIVIALISLGIVGAGGWAFAARLDDDVRELGARRG